MTIPFLDLFKRARARFGKQEPEPQVIVRPPTIEKPAGDRLSKTVMPNATRTVAPADPFQVAAGGKGRSRDLPTPLTPEPEPRERSISLTVADFIDNLPQAALKSRDSVDLNRNVTLKCIEVEKGMATGQPTALLSSIYEQAPDLFKQSVDSGDQTQVALPFEKVLKEIQALSVRSDQTEDAAVPQVETPFLQVTIDDSKKFGTSISPLQTSAVPPVKVEPATARSLAKAEPEPVAQQKHPAPISTRRSISLTPKTDAPSAATSPPAQAASAGAAPSRIPFKLPPNGAGAPASERVPASSGPPVPTPLSAPPATPVSPAPSASDPSTGAAAAKPTAPTRIPFKMTPPGPGLKPKLTLVPGIETAKAQAPTPPVEPPKPPTSRSSPTLIKLRLNVCLRNLPAFQLKGDLPEIGDDQLVELPYSLVEPQLASGRVAIEPKVFQQSIPEKYRDLFVIDTAETPVLLPLQEVLQHLPGDALQMRQDQEREEAIDHFETPFSHHAKEDQKRFGAEPLTAKSEPAKPVESGADAPKPETVSAESSKEAIEKPQPAEASPAAAKSTVDAAPAATEPASPSPGADTKPVDAQVPEPASTASEDKAQAEPAVSPETATLEAKHNAKEYVLKASCLPGITACAISFADGLTMAGNFPPSAGAEGLCAMAPSVLQKIDKHMLETNLGTLTAITLHCSKTPVSFFMRGNVCLSVMHADEQLEPVTRIQLAEMTKELAEIFAQPELTHVDH